MLENDLHALVRSTLLASLVGVKVKRLFQPTTVGVASDPTIYVQTIIAGRRVGAPGRTDRPGAGEDDPMMHTERQWWETTFQISATARRDPADPNFMTLPSASDIAKEASDILQSDKGLAALAAQRVRPLRVTDIRNVYIVNESDQYEANPSFDIVLSYMQIRESVTPPAVQFVPNAGRV